MAFWAAPQSASIPGVRGHRFRTKHQNGDARHLNLGIPFHEQQDTYGVVKRLIPEGSTMCGCVHAAARRDLSRNKEVRANCVRPKPQSVRGKLKAMPPKLVSDSLIRPWPVIAEAELAVRGHPATCADRRTISNGKAMLRLGTTWPGETIQ